MEPKIICTRCSKTIIDNMGIKVDGDPDSEVIELHKFPVCDDCCEVIENEFDQIRDEL